MPAARLVVTDDDKTVSIDSSNAAWRALWADSDPQLAEHGGGVDLAALDSVLVDPGEARALRSLIAEGKSFARPLAVDRQGPELLEAWGCACGDGYFLMLHPCREPSRIALLWPGKPQAGEAARGFRYLAAIAADGSWQIRASLPDYREVLNLHADAAGHWLAYAEPAASRALRSRHLALLAGRSQRTTYRLRFADQRSLLVEDDAEPLRHPGTGEVIGIIGRLRPVARTTRSEGAEAAESHGLVQVVQALEALGMPAALFDAKGQLETAGESALALLAPEPGGRSEGYSIASLLGADEAMATRLLASLASVPPDDAVADTGLNVPLPLADDVQEDQRRHDGRLRARLRALDIGGQRHVLLTLANEAVPDHNVRDALYFDSLTDLPNRFLFLDRLRQTLTRNAATGGSFAVLVIEIERMALFERSFGRAAAEVLAVTVAARFGGCMGELATAARLAESRFGVIADKLGGIDDAARIAQALLDQLQAPVKVGGREIGVAGRIGITFYPHDGDDAELLLGLAEAAVERLPHGQNVAYQFYTGEMNTASSDRLLMEQQLARAIERAEFVLVYQPQISFATSRIVGMEALIRWRHPELGMVPPAEFIPLAEETGAIVAIGEWVVEEACRELVGWFRAGIPPLRLAINISGRQYNDANLVPGIQRILEMTAFPPHLLELELTESVIMEDVVDAAKRLGDLHRLGINLAVDDFGTGYSSLSYLKRFPIHSLKLDRSFVRDIAHNESSASIARAIIAFGSALGLKVIAEGVETHDQYHILRAAGCDELQGYLVSRPVPPEDARRLASERRHLTLAQR